MENVSVQFAGRLKDLSNIDKREITIEIQHLVEKYNRTLSGRIDLYIKQNKEVIHQIPLFYCKAKLLNSNGFYKAYGHEYGIKQTVDQALANIHKQIIKKKINKLHLN